MADNRANRNAQSMTNAQGEFSARVPPSEPLTTKGVSPGHSHSRPLLTPGQHQVGQKTSPADSAPEFSATTAPPGTAPASNTFQPNPQGDDAIPGQADNASATQRSDPLDFPGATSADVHTGLGHPGSGQTSTELRKGQGKQGGAGLEGVGSGPRGLDNELRKLGEDRGFEQHGSRTERAKGEDPVSLTGAEGVENVKAEQVASERD